MSTLDINWVPVGDIAREHSLSLNTVRTRIADGDIRGVKIAGRWLCDADEARRVLGEQPDRRYTRSQRPTCTCPVHRVPVH